MKKKNPTVTSSGILSISLISTIKYFNNNFTRIYDWFKRNDHRWVDHHSSTQKYDQESKTNKGNERKYKQIFNTLVFFSVLNWIANFASLPTLKSYFFLTWSLMDFGLYMCILTVLAQRERERSRFDLSIAQNKKTQHITRKTINWIHIVKVATFN